MLYSFPRDAVCVSCIVLGCAVCVISSPECGVVSEAFPITNYPRQRGAWSTLWILYTHCWLRIRWLLAVVCLHASSVAGTASYREGTPPPVTTDPPQKHWSQWTVSFEGCQGTLLTAPLNAAVCLCGGGYTHTHCVHRFIVKSCEKLACFCTTSCH